MADNKEENKKGGIVKIAIFAAAKAMLLSVNMPVITKILSFKTIS